MDDQVPFDENHPGWDFLEPKEKRRFVEIKTKEDDPHVEVPAAEVAEIGGLKEIMQNGRPKRKRKGDGDGSETDSSLYTEMSDDILTPRVESRPDDWDKELTP